MNCNCYINVFSTVNRAIADVSLDEVSCVISRGFGVSAESSLDILRKAVYFFSDELANLDVSDWSSCDKLCLPRLFSLVGLIRILDLRIDEHLDSGSKRFAVDLLDQLNNDVASSYYNDVGDRFFCTSCRFVLEINVLD